ncbi:MAG: UDP-N-acetylglucosamine 2-epimerase [Promethearchaeota archaeon]
MKANNKRKHTFQYHGKDVFTLFQADFEYYYKVYLPLMVQYYELSLDLLEKENPDLVLVENEYVGFERALIYACQKKQIPSLAQQHGLITKDHIGYLYAKEDISRQEFSHFPYCPLPSCTSVIGPSFQDILTKISSYPKSKVVVSGQPRYDVFYFANRIYDRSVFLKRNKLDSKKKLVLLATQPFHLERLREEFFVNIIQSVMPIDGVQIVVKPHPNESEKWFSEKLNSLETDVLVLPPKSDTIEAIFACDVFLSVNSTTILEALIMDKPVVIVNLSKLTEPLPWVKEGAAIGVYEAEKIRGVIEDVLAKGKTDRQLSKRRSDFVYKYLYKIDGKATDRVISLMRRLAK